MLMRRYDFLKRWNSLVHTFPHFFGGTKSCGSRIARQLQQYPEVVHQCFASWRSRIYERCNKIHSFLIWHTLVQIEIHKKHE